MRRLAPFILGWFFMTSYNGIVKHDFHTEVACNRARGDVVSAMNWALTDRRVQLCREDVASGVFGFLAPGDGATFTVAPK